MPSHLSDRRRETVVLVQSVQSVDAVPWPSFRSCPCSCPRLKSRAVRGRCAPLSVHPATPCALTPKKCSHCRSKHNHVTLSVRGLQMGLQDGLPLRPGGYPHGVVPFPGDHLPHLLQRPPRERQRRRASAGRGHRDRVGHTGPGVKRKQKYLSLLVLVRSVVLRSSLNKGRKRARASRKFTTGCGAVEPS